MKKYFILLLIVIFSTLTLSGCGTTSQPTAASIPSTATPQPTDTPLPPTPTSTPVRIKLSSDAFRPGQTIPEKYSCNGEDISPPLAWSDIPPATQSLALIFDDPDAIKVVDFVWVHWLLYNIPPETTALPENVPADAELPDGSLQGKTDFGQLGYGGPCPPQGNYHKYVFKLYALDTVLDLDAGVTKEELLAVMDGHILAEGELVGGYKGK